MKFPELYKAANVVESISSALGRSLVPNLQRAAKLGVFYMPPDHMEGLRSALQTLLDRQDIFSTAVIEQASALLDQIRTREDDRIDAMRNIVSQPSAIGLLLSTSKQTRSSTVSMIVSLKGLDAVDPSVEVRQLPDSMEIDQVLKPKNRLLIRDITYIIGNMLG